MTAGTHPVLFRRSFHCGVNYYDRQRQHQLHITQNVAETRVHPSELAGCIDGEGKVDPYKARDLVFHLIQRAYDDGVKKTLGL